jgi:hypothetical protein
VGRPVLALGALAVVLAACGTAGRTPTDRQWLANAHGVVEQLRSDLVLSGAGGPDLRSATKALHDDADLYALVLAYTDFGGCNRMVANIGVATRGLAPVARMLTRACGHLQRASTLFSRAASANDPSALLSAARTAQQAAPLLVRAELQLHPDRVR